MKHLKKFNESVDNEILGDILLELKDMDLEVTIHPISSKITYLLKLEKTKVIYIRPNRYEHQARRQEVPTFEWKDVKESILRIRDYLGENLIGFQYCYSNLNILYKKIELDELNDNLDIPYKLFSINIEYTP